MTIHDQFYTNTDIAEQCFNKLKQTIDIDSFDYHMEPSAGTGAFYKLLDPDKRIGIDIDPKCEGVEKMDFLTYNPPDKEKRYLLVGNPPFGKNSSLAIQFFNRGAAFCDTIAFIVPRIFKRVSVQNKLSMDFILTYNEDLPVKPCCFTPIMDAKCCFQIWTRTNERRNKVVYDKTHSDFSFVKHGPKDDKGQPTPPTLADFAVKAYGSNCGGIVDTNLETLRPKSWHWIKANIDVKELKKRLESLNYSMTKDTVRQDSLGQQELIYLYKQVFSG
jgi:hypothetical protein